MHRGHVFILVIIIIPAATSLRLPTLRPRRSRPPRVARHVWSYLHLFCSSLSFSLRKSSNAWGITLVTCPR